MLVVVVPCPHLCIDPHHAAVVWPKRFLSRTDTRSSEAVVSWDTTPNPCSPVQVTSLYKPLIEYIMTLTAIFSIVFLTYFFVLYYCKQVQIWNLTTTKSSASSITPVVVAVTVRCEPTPLVFITTSTTDLLYSSSSTTEVPASIHWYF